MGELIITPDQLTFPWRERTRICPKCEGKGGHPWNRKPTYGPPTSKKVPCIMCKGTGELVVTT